jgi:cyclophilin family peptidyl-prolyl cis-trans isomerase
MISKSWFCGLLTAVVLVCGCDGEIKKAKVERNMVKLETSMGNIVIELNEQAAPVTVKNFLGYMEEGFYDGTIFHRVIPGFMIQGGGFTTEMEQKQTRDPIVNEADNGLKNERGTIAMARGEEPDSATCQFFINHRDNGPLNYVENIKPGYAVFGKVIEGMDVVDAIASVVTTTRKNKKGEDMGNVPVKPVVIQSARVVSE